MDGQALAQNCLRRQLGKAVQYKKLLTVRNLWKARSKASQLTLRIFLLNGFLFPLPVDAKGWLFLFFLSFRSADTLMVVLVREKRNVP